MSSTELTTSLGSIVGSGASSLLETIERAADWLPTAIAEGRSGDLLNLAGRAEAQQLYEIHRGYVASANALARLKVKCEAAIGFLDVEEIPRLRNAAPLIINEVTIQPHLRHRWRVLAIGLDRGALDEIFDDLEAIGEEVTTYKVQRHLHRKGVLRVPNSALKDGIARGVAKHGTRKQLAAEIGIPAKSLEYTFAGHNTTSSWWIAKRIAVALGENADGLPRVNQKASHKTRKKRLFLKRQRKLTGGRWDECYSRYRLFLDEFQRVADAANPRWDRAYDTAYSMEDIIGRQMKKEALGEPSNGSPDA